MKLKIRHIKSNRYLANNADLANSFASRLIGLMFSKNFGDRDGILFKPSNSIHTCFCRFPIDVIFLNSDNKIMRIYKSLVPWRFTRIVFSANQVLELPSGTIDTDIKIGDELEVIYV